LRFSKIFLVIAFCPPPAPPLCTPLELCDVRHDNSETQVDILIVDGERFLIKPANVSSKEMLLALSAKCAAKDSQMKETAKK
uniref:Uncharacterized protein n=1 Tax=Leptobrachium leishanense TaxID=445787 RepID=A0A8C5M0U3_9ANUR